MANANKVAREVAEVEFERMCEAWRVSTDIAVMGTTPIKSAAGDEGQSEVEKFQELKDKVCRRIMNGTLVVDDAGLPTYTPPVANARPLTLSKLDGAVLISGGRKKNEMEKLVEMIAGMTGRPPVEIGKLASPDLLFCGSLIALFFSAE